MGRPKKSVPAPIEPEEESQEIPEEEPEVEEEEAGQPEALPKGAVSQTDAARAALDAGHEKPAEAVKYIKDTFGIDMSPTYFSAIKTRRKADAPAAKKAEPAKRGRKPNAAAPAAESSPSPTPKVVVAPKPAANGSQPDLMSALEGVKELVSQFGPDQVKKMVDLLS